MGTTQSKASTSQLNATNAIGNQAEEQANQLYGQINPVATQMATNPTGYSPTDLSNMTTASDETLGGGQAAATGAAGLAANRTGNTGSTSSVIDQAQRTSDQQQSVNNLGIQNANANLKQTQQQEGLGLLSGEAGTDVGQTNSMYGQGANILKAGQQPGWFQQMMGDINESGQTAAKLMTAAG